MTRWLKRLFTAARIGVAAGDRPREPRGFVRATWRGTTTAFTSMPCPFGISFDCEDGRVVRLLIPESSAAHVIATLREAIAQYQQRMRSQSAISCGDARGNGPGPVVAD
jgi:hypothetical protein